MFRIGSALFIPAYLTVTLYRAFASEKSEGNLIVMLGEHTYSLHVRRDNLRPLIALGISTAVRFCGNTFSYTAISILLNYSKFVVVIFVQAVNFGTNVQCLRRILLAMPMELRRAWLAWLASSAPFLVVQCVLSFNDRSVSG